MNHAIVTLNSLPDWENADSNKRRDADIRTYLSTLDALDNGSREALLSNLKQALEVIDPAQNSIGYLYLINMALNSASPYSQIDKRTFLDKVVQLLTRFDRIQIRYVGSTFRALLATVASGTLFPPAAAVELLANAILRIEPAGSFFTSTHLHLAKLAIDSNVLEPALAVLDKEITGYPVMSSAREPRDYKILCDPNLPPSAYLSTANGLTESFKSAVVLEYNFLRSLIYTSRRDWDKAFAALEQVVTHPIKERSVSKIMTDGHKRWVLVSLLKSGKLLSLPAYSSGQAAATYNTLSATYKDLAVLFDSTNALELKLFAEMNAAIWQEDGTTSLVAEVLSSYQKWQIINLRKVFVEVSIGQVRQLTCSAQTGAALETDKDVIALIQNMIASGMIKGTLDIDGSAGSFFKFGDASTILSEEEFAREIATSHFRITTLNQQYRAANDRLSEKKEYVKYMAFGKKAEQEDVDAGIGFDSQIEDEDLMTGIMAHG